MKNIYLLSVGMVLIAAGGMMVRDYYPLCLIPGVLGDFWVVGP